MAVIGTLIKGALGGFGKKPKVPVYEAVDPTKEQQKTIAGNLENLPAAQELAAKTNKFQLEQLQQMLGSIMPGFQNIQNQISGNIQAQLSGQLPNDVQNALQNSAASRAVSGGFGGSGMARNLVARDFGLTSYQMTQQGLDSATRWMQTNAAIAAPHMMDATSMFLTPQQRIAYQFENTKNKFQRDWTANQVKAMPDPFMAALGDAFIQDEQAIMELVGQVAGMAASGAVACWVAREVYGTKDNKWKLFRHWLLNIGPKWFRNIYLKYGQRFAQWLKGKNTLKKLIGRWMDSKVEMAYEHICRSA